MDEAQKYYRHLTPVSDNDWKKNTVNDLISVCSDNELPAIFRDELRMKLKINIEEMERTIATYTEEKF